MKKYLIIGSILIGASLFSIIPVFCNELAHVFGSYCLDWEFFYTVLPLSLVLFVVGVVSIVRTRLKGINDKTIILIVLIAAVPLSISILYVGQPIFITIEGLKHEYKVDEPIAFEIKAVGFGNVCPMPNAVIFKTNKVLSSTDTNIVWADFKSACVDSQYKIINHSWKMGQITKEQIILNEPGKYKLSVSYGNKQNEKEFVILS